MFWEARTQFRQGRAGGAAHGAAEPAGLVPGNPVEEVVHTFWLKSLERHPHFRLGVVFGEQFGHVFQKGHDVAGVVVAGIATGKKTASRWVQAW